MKLDRLFTSMTTPQLERLLLAVAARLNDGFTAADAGEAAAQCSSLADGESLLLEPIVQLKGVAVPFIVDVSREGPLLQLAFITAPPLTGLLEHEFAGATPTLAVKVLRA